ncbi:outer membrane beta-barrel protein [Hydrogenophaga sp. A37]
MVKTDFLLLLLGSAMLALTAHAQPLSTPNLVPTAALMVPYLFGSLGAAHDSVIHIAGDPGQSMGASDSQTGLQLGAGMQFNEMLGAEGFVQGGQRHGYIAANGQTYVQAVRTFGARLTLGGEITDRLRLFGKAGLARVIHSGRAQWGAVAEDQAYSNRQTRSLIGFGMSYRLTDRLALRADADHIFQRRNDKNTGWGNLDFFGLGLQYSY